MSIYTEVEPLGAHPEGDVGGDDAVTEGFGRRFSRQLEPNVRAYIGLTYYFAREERKEGGPVPPLTINCEMEFSTVQGPDYDNSDPIEADVRYITIGEYEGEASDIAARTICNGFDIATLTWDGTFPVPAECWRV